MLRALGSSHIVILKVRASGLAFLYMVSDSASRRLVQNDVTRIGIDIEYSGLKASGSTWHVESSALKKLN